MKVCIRSKSSWSLSLSSRNRAAKSGEPLDNKAEWRSILGGVASSRDISLELGCLSRGLDFSKGGGVANFGLTTFGGVAEELRLGR